MTKTEMLFVRACKSTNPLKRVRSVYRRFYCTPDHENNYLYIAGIISYIIEARTTIKHGPMDIICKFQEKNLQGKFTQGECMVSVMIDLIRYSRSDEIDGYIPPAHIKKIK